MVRVEEFITDEDVSPFRRWFDALGEPAAAWVTLAIDRPGRRQLRRTRRPLGEGVSELRINRGPGYRVYFGWDGKVLVILLGGGTKKRQQSDIRSSATPLAQLQRRARRPARAGRK